MCVTDLSITDPAITFAIYSMVFPETGYDVNERDSWLTLYDSAKYLEFLGDPHTPMIFEIEQIAWDLEKDEGEETAALLRAGCFHVLQLFETPSNELNKEEIERKRYKSIVDYLDFIDREVLLFYEDEGGMRRNIFNIHSFLVKTEEVILSRLSRME